MADENRRSRRSSQAQQTPDRVSRMAENMGASSGPMRGYVPQPMQRSMPQDAAYGQPQDYPPQGIPYAQQQGMPQQPPINQPISQPVAMGAAGQRGFRMPVSQPVKPEKKKNSGLKAFLAVFLVLLIAGGAVFGVRSYLKTKEINEKIRPYDDLYCPGVYVDGIDLGGMTPEQALNSVQSQIQQRHDAWSVELTYNGETVAVINADMLEMKVDDVYAILNEAWKQGHEGTPEERYEAMVRMESEPYKAYTAKSSGNTAVIDTTLATVKEQIDRPVKNASLLTYDPESSEPFQFENEEYGLVLDTEPIKTDLYEMASSMKSGKVELVPERIQPQVTRADLVKNYTLRSSVYTPIDKHSPEERNNNIRRAFELINGTVLDPGETFSFNKVVGERTLDNGFYTAIEYAYGEHVEGVGGGVCQASTTLYQAAVCAGLQIIKREPHSDSVSYTDYGKDATVFWLGKRKIDFSFRNNTDGPIYIMASVQEDPSNKKRLIARVSIYGLDLGEVRYELVSEEIEEIPAPTEPKYVKDTAGEYVTYKDQQKSVTKAKPGHVVKSYRLEYTGTVLTDKTLLYTDRYEPIPERIYVGVKNRD